jgi:hypothetical protein
MPSYRAQATGNWSATATWQVWNGSAWVAASAVPGSADNVWANNFVVTIDQNVTVLTIRNHNTGAPGTGTVNGGGFRIVSGGIDFVCTTTIAPTMIGAANLLLVQHTSGTVNVTLSFIRGTAGTNQLVNLLGCTGNGGVTNWAGSFEPSGPNGTCFNINNGAIVNIVGNINGNGASGSGSRVIFISGVNTLVSITGTLNNTLGTVAPQITLEMNSGTLNIIGPVNATNVGGNVTIQQTGGSIFHTGSCLSSTGTCISSSGASYYNQNGLAQAGNNFTPIVMSGASTICIMSGPFICSPYGTMPMSAQRLFLSNNTSNYFEFASNSTEGALSPLPPPTRQTMYSPNTLADAPAANNVRNGVVYALGSLTGTLKVPNPANVALGIETDNTVGTAALTPESVWNHLLSAIDTNGSIGNLIKTLLDAAVSSRLAGASYTAPNNTDIAAIKAKTDSLPSSPADEATSQAILTALGNIEVDVPTPQEISTQVWTDQPDRLKNVATVESTGDQISALT